MYSENFPIRVKKARLEAGYTQVQVEKLTGIPQSRLSKFERGTLEPSLESLGTLAQFYNISINWLLGVSLDTPISPIEHINRDKLADRMINESVGIKKSRS